MSRTVLVINSGSSSIKYQLIDPDSGEALATGLVERIGESEASIHHKVAGATHDRQPEIADHRAGMQAMLALFEEVGPALSASNVVAVGHRVVQGGPEFDRAVLIDDSVVEKVESFVPLAPLHNPANLVGISAAREVFPDVPQVAVFDTAFFSALPDHATTYALDRATAEQYGVRRYGFHGTSHQYVSQKVARFLGRDDLRQVVLHLGNGASASAVVNGRPVETSMGMTPLEGLVMGTRTGDIDAAVVFHLHRAGMSVDEIDTLFNKQSGLKGLTGDNDMRAVRDRAEAGDDVARAGIDITVHRLVKYVGAYAAVMGGVDALTFTAGVGENSPIMRAEVCETLGFLGIEIDPVRNAVRNGEPRLISPDSAPVKVLVVPTNEELAIAQQSVALL